jgi:hypothetical protein
MAPIFAALIPALQPILASVVKNLFPDPEQQAKAQQEVMLQLMNHQQQIETAAAAIIQSEAASSHWLAANWRPITMLVFLGLIVARWFGYAAPDLAEGEYIKLWSIVEFGLGGYVVGRSVEKIAPSIADAIKNR